VPALLSVAEVRGFVPTDLSDGSLQILLDDAGAEISRRCGAHDSQVDTLDSRGSRWIFPTKPVGSVTSIKERAYRYSDEETALAENDYSVHDNGRSLLREPDGDNPRHIGWGRLVTVEYAPAGADDEESRRKRAQLDLVKLAIHHEGLSQQKVGNVQVSFPDYERERSRILRRLAYSGRRMLS